MKHLFVFSMLYLIFFCPLFAMAKDINLGHDSNHVRQNKCTLKNKFFCGKWQDPHGVYLTITGDHIFYRDNTEPSEFDCQIVYELTKGENPFSLLKCQYFDSYDKKYYTHYKGFYISDWSRYLDKRSPEFENITENFSPNLSDICDQDEGEIICYPEWGSRGPLSRYK